MRRPAVNRGLTIRGTTILSVRHKGRVAVAGDGQGSLGETVMNKTARKVRLMYHTQVITGFAGAPADAFALFAKLEGKLEEYQGNLPRAAVELAKDWRHSHETRGGFAPPGGESTE